MLTQEMTDKVLSAAPAFLSLANVIRAEHVSDDDGWCRACRDPRATWPCAPVRTAVRLFPVPGEPELWTKPGVLAVLASRDIASLFEILQRHGVSQRRIASYTQQSQSEVSEILGGGRRVESYQVLVRIAEGLGIPRGYMGLAYTDLPTSVLGY